MAWPEMNNLNQGLFEDVNDCEQMKKRSQAQIFSTGNNLDIYAAFFTF